MSCWSFICFVLLMLITRGSGYAIKGCEVHGEHLLKVLCYSRNLFRIPTKLPRETFSLDLSHNNIESINPTDFQNLTILQILNISNNEIHLIEPGAFQKLVALDMLNLTKNRIESLTIHMFEGLHNLTTLILNNNNIATIGPDTFSDLPNLKILGLSNNIFYKLRLVNLIFEISSLEELYIANCSLQSFTTEEIFNVSNSLKIIDASRNPFSVINFTNDNFQHLTSLDVSFSMRPFLWDIKDECFLRGLKRLNIKGTKMRPESVSSIIKHLSCSSLEEINLGYLNLMDSDRVIQQACLTQPKLQILQIVGNQYTEFTGNTFQNCSSVKVIDLSYNKVIHAPAFAFQHLYSLRELSLANNALVSLPEDLSFMMSLEKLNLINNNLKKVNLNNSNSYGSLKELDLSHNKMLVFSTSSQGNWDLQGLILMENYLLDVTDSFSSSLGKLQSLVLSKNKLSSLSANTFAHLKHLNYLNLADNQIEVIDPGAFNGLDNLHTLIIGSNKITSGALQKNCFQGLESLVELHIFGNYLNYDSPKELEIEPFHLLKSVKEITVNSQGHGMKNLPVNFFKGLLVVEKIHAGNLALSAIDPKTFSFTPELKELDLSNNAFQSIDPIMLQYVPNLTELHLSHTLLNTLDFLIKSNNTRLKLLRAVGDHLDTFTFAQLTALPSLSFLDLRNNPLTCSCANQWFIEWVQRDMKTQVLHFHEYKCADPPASRGDKLFTFNLSSCKLDHAFVLFLTTSLLISTLLILLTIWNFWRWHVVYVYYIALAFLYDRKHQEKQKSKYDAFISYNGHDEKWVFSQLVPNLEGTYKWRLCLHHRDFEPGKAIVENIVDGIYSSRKTICIISRHYLESEWCSKEIQLASYRLFDEHTDVLILLFLEDIPNHQLSPYYQIRKVIQKKSYLIWPHETNAIPLFWYKVNKALQHKKKKKERICLLPAVVP